MHAELGLVEQGPLPEGSEDLDRKLDILQCSDSQSNLQILLYLDRGTCLFNEERQFEHYESISRCDKWN